jgi:hypothetical protein
MPPATVFVLATSGVFLVVLVVLLAGASRIAGLWSSLVVASIAVLAAIGFAARGPEIPDVWITPLQEGLTDKHVRALYGDGAHAGSAFGYLISLLAPEGAGAPLRAVVRMNVALSIANAGVFLAIARRVLSWPAAIAFALVFAFNPVALHAAFSELPAALITTYFLVGTAVAGVAVDARSPGFVRRLAAVALLFLGASAALVRLETLALSLPAALALALLARAGEERIARVWAGMGRWLLGVMARPIPIILGALLGIWFIGTALSVGPGFDFLDPFFAASFGLPVTLAYFVPVGPVVLFAFGMIHCLRRPAQFLGLPLGVLALHRAYYSASHAATAPFELLRYMTFVLPVALFLALFGWREVIRLGARLQWSEAARRATRTGAALSFVCFTPTALALVNDFNGAAPVSFDRLLVRRDQQVEVRFLLGLVDRHPDCTFVSRVVPEGVLPTERAGQSIDWAVVSFGRGMIAPRRESLAGRPIANLAAAQASGCVLYYRGLDCNLPAAGDVCERDVAGLPVIAEITPPNIPYYSHVGLVPDARLSLYAMDD